MVPDGYGRENRLRVKIDTAFSDVIRACARRDETWINEEIVASYENLHSRSVTRTPVEAWQEGQSLAGGYTALAVGGGFFGESMFHRVTDASKIALAATGRTIETTTLRLCCRRNGSRLRHPSSSARVGEYRAE